MLTSSTRYPPQKLRQRVVVALGTDILTHRAKKIVNYMIDPKKVKMQDLIVSGNILQELRITPSELLIDLAVYLYDSEKLSIGQAKKLAGLTQIVFQKELSKRNVLIKYDVEDLETDLKNLSFLD